MFRSALLACALISSATAFGHHAECTFSPDEFMSCGAHSGSIEFSLQNFGDVRVDTKQLLLCGNNPVSVDKLNFKWVESDDKSTHFPMQAIKFRQVSPECLLLGNLDFTPPDAYQTAEQNAWKLEIFVKGIEIPTAVFVEAKPVTQD